MIQGGKKKSDLFIQERGVLQGSALRPLFFFYIFVNDLPLILLHLHDLGLGFEGVTLRLQSIVLVMVVAKRWTQHKTAREAKYQNNSREKKNIYL